MREIVVNQSGVALRSPLDVHKMIKRKEINVASPSLRSAFPLFDASIFGVPKQEVSPEDSPVAAQLANDSSLDFASWLPFAAKKYSISPNIADYVLVPVIIMPSDLPNRNGVGFPLNELVKFSTEHGMQHYKTWRGKGTYYEHNNQDPLKANGIIVDTFMRKFRGFGGGYVWKLVALLAFDRTKDIQLIKRVMAGDINSYSMGAYVGKYICSICHREKGLCSHINGKAKVNFSLDTGGKLAYQLACDIEGFETSIKSVAMWRKAA